MAKNCGNRSDDADHDEDGIDLNDIVKSWGDGNLYQVSPTTFRSKNAVLFKTDGKTRHKIDKINKDERATRQRITDMLFKV